jgi:copper chaperone CopZ
MFKPAALLLALALASPPATHKPPPRRTSRTTFRVEKLDKPGCAERVRRAVEASPGVSWVRISEAVREITIEYDLDHSSPQRLLDVIEKTSCD